MPQGIQPVYDTMVEPATKQDIRAIKFIQKKVIFRFVRKRDIPDSMAVLPKTRCTRCKTMISFLYEVSPKLLGLTQSSDVWKLHTRFAVFRETFMGFPKVGSVLSEALESGLHWTDARICPKVLSPFNCSNFTLLEISFFPADALMTWVRTIYRRYRRNNG